MSTQTAAFDYESKQWGGAMVLPRPWYIQGLKLAYCLKDLAGVSGACADLGCGAGNMAKAIKRERPDLEVYGSDLSRSAIEVANRDPQGVEFRLASVEKLPFADSSLDAVTMFDVLEHVQDPAGVLAEISRVLRPGGVFHIALPLESQRGTIYAFLTARGWKAKLHHCGHIQIFDDRRFRELAIGAGLPVRRVRWSFLPLYSLVDVAYFSCLELRGPVGHSVEDYLATGRGPLRQVLRAAKSAISSFGWYEARILQGLPGGTGHFICVKGPQR